MPNVFKQGEHICALYDTEEEQLAVAAEYLGDGLQRGEQCLYAAESRAALNRFRAALKKGGIDANDAARRGALIELTTGEAHLVGGHFDCERMLRMLNDSVERALNNGYTGFRSCGDMSWLLGDWDGRDQVREYEMLLNEFFQAVRAAGMCQYDRRRLASSVIDDAMATHSSMVMDRRHQPNPVYKPHKHTRNRH